MFLHGSLRLRIGLFQFLKSAGRRNISFRVCSDGLTVGQVPNLDPACFNSRPWICCSAVVILYVLFRYEYCKLCIQFLCWVLEVVLSFLPRDLKQQIADCSFSCILVCMEGNKRYKILRDLVDTAKREDHTYVLSPKRGWLRGNILLIQWVG